MRLDKWIENKKSELIIAKTYKSIEFVRVNKVEISALMTSMTYNIGTLNEKTTMDTEVEEFERSEIVGEIDGLEISFDVIKPRCRKPVKLYLQVKISA